MKLLRVVLLVSVFFVSIEGKLRSQPILSVGPKLGYTFGEGGGFTYGLEVSYVPVVGRNMVAYTCDLTLCPLFTSVHVGIEAFPDVGILGADFGPTLFFQPDRAPRMGVSLIPFFGILWLFGYYEFGYPFGGTVFQALDSYLKIPFGLRFTNGSSF